MFQIGAKILLTFNSKLAVFFNCITSFSELENLVNQQILFEERNQLPSLFGWARSVTNSTFTGVFYILFSLNCSAQFSQHLVFTTDFFLFDPSLSGIMVLQTTLQVCRVGQTQPNPALANCHTQYDSRTWSSVIFFTSESSRCENIVYVIVQIQKLVDWFKEESILLVYRFLDIFYVIYWLGDNQCWQNIWLLMSFC